MGSRAMTRKTTYDLKLTFGELTLIYQSLLAVRALGVLAVQDELLVDATQAVDQALARAV
jgi:hypothetical protein